ncbi:nucleotide-binding universal stress UspA family protein [Kineosphaera limosa]|uniref:UspA family protein n=1 Tax=Kineosphaera limosa NBRC 100340 TaxID=1184609 RepID=K6WXT3_9MICO|nr:universal stress protein [Kineosphaera limosa]NYE00280.1 nucleotide-binding universal stress UspA family protein [Kineosphaera limosa]GAB96892.1 UspA family protein [Kineosphaera limosa NBRC 100340]
MSAEPVPTNDIPDGAVLVSVAGDDLDETCLAWAAAAAQRTGRPLHVVHARDEAALMGPDPAMGGWAVHTIEVPKGDPFLDDTLRQARERWPELEISGSAPFGRREKVLLDASPNAYMSVVGAPKRTGLQRFFLSRPSLAAAMHSACPVVIVPHGVRPEPDGPVVVAVDGSGHSRFALDRAFTVARTRGDQLIVVTTFTLRMEEGVVVTEAGTTASWESAQEHARAVTQEMVEQVRQNYPEVEVEVKVLGGHPSSVITAMSKEAGLIVLGSRGRGGFTGMLLGSTTHEVIETATCPVLVARRNEAA